MKLAIQPKNTKKSFTLEMLLASQTYKEWVTADTIVTLIHDTYYDDEDDYATYIVVIKEAKDLDRYKIWRFFKSLGSEKIHMSGDHHNLTAQGVMIKLLEEYSRGLA